MKARAGRAFLSHLTKVDWCYINLKFALWGCWMVILLMANTSDIVGVFGNWILWLWIIGVTAGLVISLSGLVYAAQRRISQKLLGFRLELSGLYLFLIGPFCYTLVLIHLLLEHGLIPSLIAQFLLAYTLGCAIMARIFMVKKVAIKSKDSEPVR